MAATGVSQGFDYFDDRMRTGSTSLSIGEIQRSGYESEKIAETWIAGHEKDPVLLLPPPLRAAHAVRSARAVQVPLRLLAVRRRDRDRRRHRRPVPAVPSGARRCTTGRSSSCSRTTAKASAITARTSTACSSTAKTLHVPLLVKLPRERRAGERIDAPVGLVDVVPTVLDLTGTGEAGRSFRPLAAFGGPGPPDLQRDVLSALSLRLERSRVADRSAIPVHSRKPRRVVRHRDRSGRAARPCAGASAGFSIDAQRALRHGSAGADAGRRRRRAGPETRLPRLSRRRARSGRRQVRCPTRATTSGRFASSRPR